MSDKKGHLKESSSCSSPPSDSFKSPFSEAHDSEQLHSSERDDDLAQSTKFQDIHLNVESGNSYRILDVDVPVHSSSENVERRFQDELTSPGKLFTSDEEEPEKPLSDTRLSLEVVTEPLNTSSRQNTTDIQCHTTYENPKLKNTTGFVPTVISDESNRENEAFDKALSTWSCIQEKREGIKIVDGIDPMQLPNSRPSQSKSIGNSEQVESKATDEQISTEVVELDCTLDWESIDEVIDIPKGKKLTLLLHQRKGVRWLIDLFEKSIGGILADDMGLGKTVQCCVMLKLLFDGGRARRILILSPKSVLGQWEEHITKICGRVIGLYVYHGSKKTQILEDFGDEDIGRRRRILLTTYETFKSNATQLLFPLNRKRWDVWIADEATSMKNPASASWKAASQIEARCRIMLTGTPIMNNYIELWALIDLAVPSLLGEYKTFKQQYAPLIDRTQRASESLRDKLVTNLRRELHPYLMRRTKEEIFRHEARPAENQSLDAVNPMSFLPPKTDLIILLDLSYIQYELYRGVRERLDLRRRADVLVNMSHLLSLCRHPVLCLPLFLQTWREKVNSQPNTENKASSASAPVNELPNDEESAVDEGAVDDEVKEILRRTRLKMNISDPDVQFIMENLDQSSTEQMRQACPKLECLFKLLPVTLGNGHSLLVFSYSTATLDLVEAYVMRDLPDIKYLRLDGSVDSKGRQKILQHFSDDDTTRVMLLSTKAGGLGLNLTKADRVVILDPNWNPALDNQAIDRAYRIGQKRSVLVYRLICGGTIEDNMLKTQLLKMDLSSSVLAGTSFKPWLNWRDMQSLFHLSRAAQSQLKELLVGRVSHITESVGNVNYWISTQLAQIYDQLKGEFGETLSPLEFLNADSIFSMDEAINETRELRIIDP